MMQSRTNQSQTMANSTAIKRDKIFNVRKLPYKHFDHQKYLKQHQSPHHNTICTPSSIFKTTAVTATLPSPKNMEYYIQLTLTSAPIYKQLQNKHKTMKERHAVERQNRLRVFFDDYGQMLQQKQEQLEVILKERLKIQMQQERLLKKREELCYYIEGLRSRRQQREQGQYMQQGTQQGMVQMMMGLHYQAGIDIDPDTMTYQQLLQLQQKMGKVSKGLTQTQYQQIPIITANRQHCQELCSICYQNVKQGENIHQLKCGHVFHCQCIKEWFGKEKVCPMCKREIGAMQK